MSRLCRYAAATALLGTAATLQAQDVRAGYMNHAGLSGAVEALAGEHASIGLAELAVSREGRSIPLLTLSAHGDRAHDMPAVLIVAGLDARHWVGTETAVRIARIVAAEHADLLNEVTIYIIPRVNPDGTERNLTGTNYGHIGTMRVVDLDRDGTANEDGPIDLNGDGVITMIRRANPPLSDAPTHVADPHDPRLLKPADHIKGERAVYSIHPEGLDQDGDGRIAEDGPGGVDLDKNFMHRWPEFSLDAGPFQLSEPESLALAEFVLERENIFAVVVYGRHDNMINVPDPRPRDDSGRTPRDLDTGDQSLYQELSTLFKETTGQKRAPREETAGSFQAWTYAQRGLPTFATVVWGRPDPSAPADADAERDRPRPHDAEEAAWLAYSDRDRGGAGFVDWQPFDHPTLGSVEIGGWVPGFKMNPPIDEVDELSEKQAAFLAKIIDRRPQLSTMGPYVKRLASGLYEIEFGLVNDGYLPTTTSMAQRTRTIMPTILRLSVEVPQIHVGNRLERAWGVDGSGGRAAFKWLVQIPDGADISIEMTSPHFGNRTFTFTAADTNGQPAEVR